MSENQQDTAEMRPEFEELVGRLENAIWDGDRMSQYIDAAAREFANHSGIHLVYRINIKDLRTKVQSGDTAAANELDQLEQFALDMAREQVLRKAVLQAIKRLA